MNHDTHPWTMTIPVLSTRHLTQATYTLLESGTYPWFLVALYDCGLFLYVPGDDQPETEYPEIGAIFVWARQQGYTWVRLDSVGSEVDLPLYEWET